MSYRKLRAIALSCMAIAANGQSGLAHADDASGTVFKFSGFSTLAYSTDDRGDLAPIRDITQRPGNDYRTGPSFLLDSRIGVQLSAKFSSQWQAVIQAVARSQESHDFEDFIDLAYLDYRPSSELRFRFGRVGYDTFLMSDHRNLGYSYAWVRPPTEYYAWIPLFGVDGGDISYEFNEGEAAWRLRAQAGSRDVKVPMGDASYTFKAGSLWSLSATRESGPWRIKAGLSRFTSTKEVQSLSSYLSGLDQISALHIASISDEATFLRRESTFKDVDLQYATVAAAYDDGKWFGQAELGSVRTTRAFVPQANNGYAVLGHRMGTLSPFLMVGVSRPARARLQPANDWSVLGADATGLQDVAYKLVINSTRSDQDTLSVGVRWDVSPQTALKMQWDHTRIQSQGYAAWFASRDTVLRDSKVNMLTVSIDCLF